MVATGSDPARVTHIRQQCDELEELCDTLHSVIGQLDERLMQATRPVELKIATQEDEKEPPTLVPLAMFLRCRNEAIQTAIDRLNGLRQRIEL